MPANSAAGENGIGGLFWYLPAMISVSKKFSAAALDAHHRLAGRRFGVGNIGQFEVVGRAVMGAEQGFHGGSRLQAEGRYSLACQAALTIGRLGWRIAAFTLPIFAFNGLLSSDSSRGGISAVAPLNR